MKIGFLYTCVNGPGVPPSVRTEVMYQPPLLWLSNYALLWYDIRGGKQSTWETTSLMDAFLLLPPLAPVFFRIHTDCLTVLSPEVFSPDAAAYGLWAHIYAPGQLLQLCS